MQPQLLITDGGKENQYVGYFDMCMICVIDTYPLSLDLDNIQNEQEAYWIYHVAGIRYKLQPA